MVPIYDLIIGNAIKELSRKALEYLTCLQHYSKDWLFFVLVESKGSNSYPKISSPQNFLKHYTYGRTIISAHQFGFWEHHATLEHIHRMTMVFTNTAHKKKKSY